MNDSIGRSRGASQAFETFLAEAPAHAKAWMGAVEGLAAANALDEKTRHLAYLAVLAALRFEGGVPLHVRLAKKCGCVARGGDERHPRRASRGWQRGHTVAAGGPRRL
jgi:alkylhydroperoxidase/carboxymuconolactone decarboxylase family protein YurZ